MASKNQRDRKRKRRKAANRVSARPDNARRALAREFENSWKEALELGESQAVPERHHRVPAFWIRKWADENGRVRCYDLEAHRSFVSMPKRVMVERNYYRMDDATWGGTRAIPPLLYELALAQVEARAAPALERWLDDPLRVSTPDFSAVASLLTIQMLRGERNRNMYRSAVAEVYKEAFDPNHEDPNHAWFAKELRADQWRIAPSETELVARMFDLFQPALEALVHRQWILFDSPTELPLGDEPVVTIGGPEFERGRDVGFTTAGVIVAPVARNRLVAMFRPDLAFRLGCGDWKYPLTGVLTAQEGLEVAREICMAQERWIVEHPMKNLAENFHIPDIAAVRHRSEDAPDLALERGAVSAKSYFATTRWAHASVRGTDWPVRRWWR